MNKNAVFIDTWGWVALGHRKDSQHSRVKLFYKELCDQKAGIYTSDYVIDEVITLLFRREKFAEALRFVEGILSSATFGYLRIERITSKRFEAAWKLRKRFKDKPLISFTDLTSMAIMKEWGISRVLTDDEHFLHLGMDFIKVP